MNRLLHIPPVLQMLLALACSLALLFAGERGEPVLAAITRVARLFYRLVRIVSRFAPLAAFGAIAFTVGRYGLLSLGPLLKLLVTLYLASAAFVALVLGAVARMAGVSLWRLIAYVKDELLIVIGTSASMSVLPQLLTALAVATLLSKSASGVAGSAFLTLSAIVAATPMLPVGSMALLIGIERLLKCRTLTNIIGNVVACVAIAVWSGELDRQQLECALAGTLAPDT